MKIVEGSRSLGEGDPWVIALLPIGGKDTRVCQVCQTEVALFQGVGTATGKKILGRMARYAVAMLDEDCLRRCG